jgi:hypothetical protein
MIASRNAGERSAIRFDANVLSTLLIHQQPRNAARGVAATLDLSAVGVENPHEGIRAVFCRLNHNHLIATDTEATVGDGACGISTERERLLARVEYNEIVAEALHFQECRHNGLYKRSLSVGPVG